MTHRAIRFFIHVVRIHPIDVGVRWRFPRMCSRREHQLARADEPAGVAMALQAPFHVERRFAIHKRHPVDIAMARYAAHALAHMDAVIEAGEVGEVVHAVPYERLAAAKARPHRSENRAFRPQVAVAVHAGLRGRDPGKRRLLDARVAVAAIDATIRYMMLVAEWNRLLLDNARARGVRRAGNRRQQPDDERHDKHRAEDRGAGYRVHARMKNLRHRNFREAREVANRACAIRISHDIVAVPDKCLSRGQTWIIRRTCFLLFYLCDTMPMVS
jgi:hypothetical protein